MWNSPLCLLTISTIGREFYLHWSHYVILTYLPNILTHSVISIMTFHLLTYDTYLWDTSIYHYDMLNILTSAFRGSAAVRQHINIPTKSTAPSKLNLNCTHAHIYVHIHIHIYIYICIYIYIALSQVCPSDAPVLLPSTHGTRCDLRVYVSSGR